MTKLSGFALAALLSLAAAGSYAQQNTPRPPLQTGPTNAQQQLPPGTGSISGIVVAAGTGIPIPEASVELRRIDCNNFANPPEVFNTKPGPDGKFSFSNLHAGGWCIVATSAGGKYTPAEYPQHGSHGRGGDHPLPD